MSLSGLFTDSNLNDDEAGVDEAGTLLYLTGPTNEVQLGKMFAPMMSMRTNFYKLMDTLSKRHRLWAQRTINAAKEKEEDPPAYARSLAVWHPAFSIETKLDGERMLVHYDSTAGTVKIHSRRNNWYSKGYSPVLGRGIRAAFGHNKFDLILDGEVLAWDNTDKETIPFGFNRTIANFRRQHMANHDMLDPRDENLHDDIEDDDEVYNFAAYHNDVPSSEETRLAGKECWLQVRYSLLDQCFFVMQFD